MVPQVRRELRSPMFLDVSCLFTKPRISGIQRVILAVAKTGLLEGNVRFNSSEETFETSTLPEYRFPTDSTKTGLLVKRLVANTLSILDKSRSGGQLIDWLRRRLPISWISGLTGASLRDTRGGQEQKVAPLMVRDLLILDPVTEDEYLDFLERSVSNGSLRIHVFIFDLIPIAEAEQSSGGFRRVKNASTYGRFLRLALRAQNIFFSSRYTEKEFWGWVAAEGHETSASTGVLYPPVEKKTDPTHEVAVLNPGIPVVEDDRVCLAIAPLTRRKNLKVVFEAMRAALSYLPSIKLVVVSPPTTFPDTETLNLGRALQRKYPSRVFLLGQVESAKLEWLLSRSHVILNPSILEGFGYPAIDAVHRGIHCVASRASTYVELAELTPIKLVSPTDPNEWVEEIILLCQTDLPRPVDTPFPSSVDFVRQILAALKE